MANKTSVMKRLVLFLTRGGSLSEWERVGILDRELEIYRLYQNAGWDVTIISFGGSEEIYYQRHLNGIKIRCNYYGLPQRVYRKMIPFLFIREFISAELIKTNQFNGSEIAIQAGLLWRKPVLVRMGYLWSSLNNLKEITEKQRSAEKFVFSNAAAVSVTTQLMKDYIREQKYPKPTKVFVNPNYVNTEKFAPNISLRQPRKVCCVAKFFAQKNLVNLFYALAGCDVELDLVGSGDQRDELTALSSELGIKVNFLGNIPNDKVPNIINRSEIFILPSLFEGNPKALMEAMSCGSAVIGSNVTGIRELITHLDNGYLCEPTIESMKSALLNLINDPFLRKKIGENARAFAISHFSLESVFERELSIVNSLSTFTSK